MLDMLESIFESLILFFESIDSFLNEGIYSLFTWVFAKFVEEATIAYYDFVLWAVPFAWSVAKQIMIDLDLSSLLSSAWGSLDDDSIAIASILKIPESVNLIISASFTKFTLRFIPFL